MTWTTYHHPPRGLLLPDRGRSARPHAPKPAPATSNGHLEMYPMMVPGACSLIHEQLASQIDAERRHFQLNRDNAILMPEPSALAFATNDLFWTWRMVEITWAQWRKHINNMLFPDDSSEGKMLRMRNQDDEFSTLFQYLNWN